MEWLANLKNNLLQRQVNKLLQNKSNRKATNFADCQNISILFNANDNQNLSAVFQYIRLLIGLNKNVSALGFWNANDLSNAPTQYPIFNKKNLSFANVPKGELIENFNTQNSDLLLALYITPLAALDYLIAASQAKFKVGFYSEVNCNLLDFMLYSKNIDLETAVNQLHSQLQNLDFK